jgi:phosphoribosylanthranilate isomerase
VSSCGQADRLILLPAVDIADGRAVQLVQGISGSGKQFGDPVAAARRWAASGAEWIHLVDLDAAFGRGHNAATIRTVIDELTAGGGVRVELSGGIRDDASLAAALDAGASRVNVGTAALEDPDWCARVIKDHGDRVAVGLDVRDNRLAARGWTSEGGDVFQTLDRLEKAGCARYVVTDVASDGMLTGPNTSLLRSICRRTDKPVVASGGISTLDDLRRLRELTSIGVEGAIIGTALYAGNFTLRQALAVATPPSDPRVTGFDRDVS